MVGKGKELARIPVAKWRFDLLTAEDAFDLACHVPEVQTHVLPHVMRGQHFTKHEAFEATLELDYEVVPEALPKRPQLSAEELKLQRQQEKEARRQEKAAKKAARALRIQQMEEVEKRKAAKSIPKKKQG